MIWKEICNEVSRYDGEYVNGKKTGKGKFIWNDGSSYDGDWLDNKLHGFVIIFFY